MVSSIRTITFECFQISVSFVPEMSSSSESIHSYSDSSLGGDSDSEASNPVPTVNQVTIPLFSTSAPVSTSAPISTSALPPPPPIYRPWSDSEHSMPNLLPPLAIPARGYFGSCDPRFGINVPGDLSGATRRLSLSSVETAVDTVPSAESLAASTEGSPVEWESSESPYDDSDIDSNWGSGVRSEQGSQTVEPTSSLALPLSVVLEMEGALSNPAVADGKYCKIDNKNNLSH